MAEVTLSKVVKLYGGLQVVHGVDLEVQSGEFLVLVGPSGCGKSTLLRMIAGLEEVSDGTISIAGRVVNDVPASQRNLSMVFQSYALYPHMSVRKNLAFGPTNLRMPRPEIERRVAEAARILQIEELMERKPRQLSGGQKQRVAIGRAIVRESQLFLFDEPLSNLDAELRVQMRVELANLYNRLGTTMIYVTHDQVEAMTMATRIAVLNKGQVEQVGTPYELYNFPRNRFVATFIGSPKMNLLPATVDGGAAQVEDFGALPLAAADGALSVGVRPEQIGLGKGGELTAEGTVTLVEYLGSEIFLYVRLASGRILLAKAPGGASHKIGERLPVSIAARNAHCFDANGQRLPLFDNRERRPIRWRRAPDAGEASRGRSGSPGRTGAAPPGRDAAHGHPGASRLRPRPASRKGPRPWRRRSPRQAGWHRVISTRSMCIRWRRRRVP
jgi:ABC-type sugar transport system ATPase subunit